MMRNVSEMLQQADGIAQMVRQLNRESVVREFFAKEPKPERGLPAYPNVGTAVSVTLKFYGGRGSPATARRPGR